MENTSEDKDNTEFYGGGFFAEISVCRRSIDVVWMEGFRGDNVTPARGLGLKYKSGVKMVEHIAQEGLKVMIFEVEEKLNLLVSHASFILSEIEIIMDKMKSKSMIVAGTFLIQVRVIWLGLTTLPGPSTNEAATVIMSSTSYLPAISIAIGLQFENWCSTNWMPA